MEEKVRILGDEGTGGPDYIKRKAQLLLSNPDTENGKARQSAGSIRDDPKDELITFIVKGASLDILKYFDESTSMLECEISRYSTQGIQVPWPNAQTGTEMVDAWFTGNIKHNKGKFIVTVFFKQLPENNEGKEKKQTDQAVPIGDTDRLYLSAVYLVRTTTPLIQTPMKKDALLDCTFALDHSADVIVEWRFQYKGEKKKLFAYNGPRKQVEHTEKGVQVLLDGIPKGNASLLVRNIALKNEGTYTCSVYVPPLFGIHNIQLEILEIPKVTLNTYSLSLTEGEEKKLSCEISQYYPLDVQVEWLRELEGERLIPVIVKDILFSSHRHNTDGTFSLSCYFMLKASLKENGVKYTCRVQHKGLKSPIRSSVRVTVAEHPLSSFLVVLGILLIIIFIGLLISLLRYLHQVNETSKKKPY
nr:PREDICTED: tapasin-related protein-like isoform X2 [Latimeria chalumnae]|eukprot:XP_014347001.1 PREDICTED: tapasin-related protein-like isoform X2 [Latimeria chalumnae]